MKISKDVTPEIIEGVINNILDDLQDDIDESNKEYEKDKTDDFHKNMSLMFGIAKEMIESRLSQIAAEE